MAKEIVSAQRLRELLHYDPETGIFTRAVTLPGKGQCKAGTVCGSPHGDGYVVVTVDRRNYLAHRLAWLYTTGEWPDGRVDHRFGDRSDNRFSRLRVLPHNHNLQNQRDAHVDNKSGFLGVTVYRKRFVAAIGIGGKTKHLGVFDAPEEAHAAYLEAKRRLHPGCTI